MSGQGPPRWLERLLARVLPASHRQDVLDDLALLFRRRVADAGRGRALLWYLRQVGRELMAVATGESTREGHMGGWSTVKDVIRDGRFAVRSFLATPAFTVSSGLTLVLGIAGTTTMFAVVDQVLLRPLPYPSGERLVHLVQTGPTGGGGLAVSWPNVEDVADAVDGLDGLSAWRGWGFLDQRDGVTERLSGASVTPSYFDLLGLEPAVGRFFASDDVEQPRIVVSHAYWTGRLASDPGAVGRTVSLDGYGYTVVGVAPPGFVDPVAAVAGLGQPDAWRLLSGTPTASGRSNRNVWSIGRLATGVGIHDLDEEMRAVSARLADAHPAENDGQSFHLIGAREARVGDVRRTLLILLGAVGVLLAIACANVANLFLARGTARRRELALRSAVGASRGRLLAQLLTEAAVFALAAGAVGIVASWIALRALSSASAVWLPRAETLGLDPRMVAFALLTSLLTAALFGLVPALRSAGTDLAARLRGSRGGTERDATRLRTIFAASQLALAVVLLSGMGLVLESFLRLTGEELGLDAPQVLTAEVIVDRTVHQSREAQNDVVARLIEGMGGLPAVRSAAGINALPMSGRVDATNVIRAEDEAALNDDPEASARLPRFPVRTVTPGYFGTVGMPVISGRDFAVGDGADAPPVAVVNRALARHLFGDDDPLGRRVVVRGATLEVVGVVGDVRQFGPHRAPEPALYTVYDQEAQSWMRGTMNVALRVGSESGPTPGAVREAVANTGPGLIVVSVARLDTLLGRHLAVPRFRLALATIFGALALILSAVGVGAMAGYTVARRTREYAVRLACGARPDQVVRSIAGSVGAFTLAGLGTGFAAALVSSRLLTGILYGVSPGDVRVHLAVVAVLAAVVAGAAAAPARRVLSIDPARVLRDE